MPRSILLSALALGACLSPTGYGIDYSDTGWWYTVDVDLDGYPIIEDCDDQNPGAFPGAAELESLDACMIDRDGDGYGAMDVEDVGDGGVDLVSGVDCDDGDAGAFPDADEACDLEDDDCDGDVDEGAPLCEGSENGVYGFIVTGASGGGDVFSGSEHRVYFWRDSEACVTGSSGSCWMGASDTLEVLINLWEDDVFDDDLVGVWELRNDDIVDLADTGPFELVDGSGRLELEIRYIAP